MYRPYGRLPLLEKLRLVLLASGLAFFIGPSLMGQKPGSATLTAQDSIANLQSAAVSTKQAAWGHWGPNDEVYSSWTTHSNRLIPVYTFGIDLNSVRGQNSVYRDASRLEKLYGFLPEQTVNPQANYFDQTDVYRLQKMAVDAGKKRVILFVFDGMDWETSRAAAISKLGRNAYQDGRGTGLHFQDYRGVETDFGFCVTSPHNHGTSVDVDQQRVTKIGTVRGGYDPVLGGPTPWHSVKTDQQYLIGKSKTVQHAYTDSAASATSLTSGIKTYNASINVDPMGRPATPLPRRLQEEGFKIGIVTSVPISHATPACAYANNVSRNDYQDLTRELIGQPSIFHAGGLPGVDVLIGCGWGVSKEADGSQGDNFVPGNKYISAEELRKIDAKNGGRYVISQRTAGLNGETNLKRAVAQAKKNHKRLFGFYGTSKGHLPYQTADGNFDPVVSPGDPKPTPAEAYTKADLHENVTLTQMTLAAVDVLNSRSDRWWLMVESGDVDWANHANNIDNSIGAVHSGDDAFEALVQWIEDHGGWKDTALILTADHGHYLNLNQPEALISRKVAIKDQEKSAGK